jgi:hypothetical protein
VAVSIVFDDLTPDLVLMHRRWSRIRRIRTTLRSIRRQYPQIRYTHHRHCQTITVEFVTELDLFQFMLVAPSTLPRWRRL